MRKKHRHTGENRILKALIRRRRGIYSGAGIATYAYLVERAAGRAADGRAGSRGYAAGAGGAAGY